MGSVTSPVPAAIIRSSQKDDEFVSQKIRKEIDELFQHVFGIRKWIENRERLQVISHLLYFSCTTLSGLQTLGEEHTLLLLVHDHRLQIPSFLRRSLLVLLQCGSWLLIKKSLNSLSHALDNPDAQFWPQLLNRPDVRTYIFDHITQIQTAIGNLIKLNEALFYINGVYLTIPKRILNVQYTALNTWKGDGTSPWLYKFLGYLSLFQVLASIITQKYIQNLLHKALQTKYKHEDDSFNQQAPTMPKTVSTIAQQTVKCSFCLSHPTSPTCTPCGHLFCWLCIQKWAQEKQDCPFCRKPLLPSRLIFLQNV